MDKPTRKFRRMNAEHLVKKLNKRRMDANYVETAAEAKQQILDMIQGPCSVLRCGTESVGALGLWQEISAKPDVKLIDPYEPGLTPEQGMQRRREGLSADFMLASTNALTLDGRLVNLDGVGNRVAAMMFGPSKVILLVGMNKVVTDLESAMKRIRDFAAPTNNLRLKAAAPDHEPPCTLDGRCHNCASPQRICNAWTIIEGQRFEGRIHVILVGEDLGY